MSTEQPQPDWALQLVYETRAQVYDEKLSLVRHKHTADEAAALIRIGAAKYYDVYVKSQLASLSTVCARWKTVLEKISHGAALWTGEDGALLRCDIYVCAEEALALTPETVSDQLKEAQERIKIRTDQLARICKEGFNNDDTVSNEPADDYVLRKLAQLQAELKAAKEDAQSRKPLCAECGKRVGKEGPPDGWQLEDGRTVCHACCVSDTRRVVSRMTSPNK